jgi:hypothetical protein
LPQDPILLGTARGKLAVLYDLRKANAMTMFSGLEPAPHLSISQPVLEPAAKRHQSESQILSVLQRIDHPTSMAERWASYVVAACKSERDPKTLAIWARQVGVSYTTLSESCRLIDIQPRHARDFTRVLRIILMPAFDFRKLSSFLDISDMRTLDSILQTAGFGQHAAISHHISVRSFLDNQQFIVCENPGLLIIQDAFAAA